MTKIPVLYWSARSHLKNYLLTGYPHITSPAS